MSELVRDRALPHTRREHGTTPTANDRVAIVASYGEDARVSRSLGTLVGALHRGGYLVVVVRASSDDAPLQWPESLPEDVVVLRKPNIGYDFGSWAVAMELFPQLLTSGRVLLVNDSLLGPFGPVDSLLSAFEGSASDVWGVTNTTQYFPHLQSYILGFTEGVLTDAPLRRFWHDIQILDDKDDIVARYEIGLSRLFFREGYATSSWFDHSMVAERGFNPSLWGWRRLLDLGFPFVKRQLLTLPEIVDDGSDVPAQVKLRFGVDPRAWI